MPRGGARPNSGPKKGYKKSPDSSLKNEDKATVTERFVNYGEASLHALVLPKAPPAEPLKTRLIGESPLEFMLRQMRNSKNDISYRLKAAHDAAEYIHAKQPQAVHVTSEVRLSAVVVHVEAGPWNESSTPPKSPPNPLSTPKTEVTTPNTSTSTPQPAISSPLVDVDTAGDT